MRVELSWDEVVLLSEAVGTHLNRVAETLALTEDRAFADDLRDRSERLERLRDHLDLTWTTAVTTEIEPVRTVEDRSVRSY